MAQGEATLLIKIKEMGAAAITSVKDKLISLIPSVKQVIAGLIALGAGIAALAIKASAFKEVSDSFHAMARNQGKDADEIIKKMREMSQGTVTDLELMKSANKAMMMGLPVDRLGEMARIAKSASQATGASTEEMMQALTRGLGKQNSLMLGSVGIILNAEAAHLKYANSIGTTVDKLTDAEKKQAFINEALRIGGQNADAAGTQTLSLADKWEQFKVKISNLAMDIGVKLGPAVSGALDLIIKLTDATSKFLGLGVSQYDSLIKKQQELKKEEQDYLNIIKSRQGAAQEMARQALEYNRQKQEALQNELNKLAEVESAKDAATEADKVRAAQAIEAKRISDEMLRAQDLANKELLKEDEALFQQGIKDAELQSQWQKINEKIKSETDYVKFKTLLDKKESIRKQAIDKGEMLQAQEKAAREMELNGLVASNAAMLGNNLVALTQGNNKEIVALQKALAIASIIIQTEIAKMRAPAELGPILGSIYQGVLEAQRAVSIALVLGVRMAEGGIVKATPGGVPAIIGEGGRDEAVIPLEDGAPALGTTINITVNGGLLGDENSAREFAKAVDRELVNLQKNNESEALGRI